MRLLAFVPLAITVIIGGCDDNNPVDAKTEEKKEIIEHSGQGEDPAFPTAAMKKMKERIREKFGEDDPSAFATDEPVGIRFGSALTKENEKKAGKDD